MRRYLKEFLSDQRVIEAPRAVWLVILQLILLRRPTAKGRDYAAIWNTDRDEGPLKTITRSQSEKLAEALKDLSPAVDVDWAMRYGLPPIAERLRPCTPRAATGSRGPALSAILRRDDRDGRRQGVRRPEGDALAAGGPRSPRPGTTTRPISRRWRARPARAWRGSISSRRSCWPRSTAFRSPISRTAIPITAIAPRRRGSSPPRSDGRRGVCG